jgi:hypothetical protein
MSTLSKKGGNYLKFESYGRIKTSTLEISVPNLSDSSCVIVGETVGTSRVLECSKRPADIDSPQCLACFVDVSPPWPSGNYLQGRRFCT